MDISQREIIEFQRRKKILPFATALMNLEDIMPSEISQTQKDKKYDFIYMSNLK